MQITQIRQDNQRAVRLADTLQRHMARYGYLMMETPIIQDAELFLTKAGDQIVNRLFTFERYGRQLALRPEFTATAAHYYTAHHRSAVARWQFSGSIFEDDPARANHEYQHFSIGAELIGLAGALADSEIISMTVQGLAAEGIDDWRLVIGHAGLTRLLVRHFHLDTRTEHFLLNHLNMLKDQGKSAVLAQIDKLLPGQMHGESTGGARDDSTEMNTQQMLDAFLDATQSSVTMGGRNREDIVRRLLQKRRRAAERQQILQALDLLHQWVQISAAPESAFAQMSNLLPADDTDCAAALAQWRSMLPLLAGCDIPAERITIQPDLARSWEYYTGVVFEVYSHDGLHLAGGGRYDELIRLISGAESVPAVGFVYYPDEILRAAHSSDIDENRVVTLAAAPGAEVEAMRWAQRLRSHGIPAALLPVEFVHASTGLVLRVDGADVSLTGTTYQSADIDRLAAALRTNLNHD